MSRSKANKSRTFNILDRVLVRCALAGDGRWEIHQADKPYTFQPHVSVSTVTNEEGKRILNIILGPVAIDVGLI